MGKKNTSRARRSTLTSTPFIHAETGIPIVISSGLNGAGRMNMYSIYAQKANGCLERCTEFGFHNTVEKAMAELKAYKGSTLTRKETTKGY